MLKELPINGLNPSYNRIFEKPKKPKTKKITYESI